jgi:hypothetical protein
MEADEHPFLEKLRREFAEADGAERAMRALMAFHVAVMERRPIPAWAAQFISDGIARFLDESSIDLDQALGVAVGRGQSPPRVRAAMEGRDFYLMLDLWRLVVHFGASVLDAAHAVEGKQRAHGKDATWSFGGGSAKQLSADTLADRFVKEHWQHKLDELMGSLSREVEGNAAFDEQAYLQSFPPHALPPGLKSRISRPR